jgi:hypothetical protein
MISLIHLCLINGHSVCHDPFGEFPTSFNFANKKFSTADIVSQFVVMLAIKYRTFPRTLE